MEQRVLAEVINDSPLPKPLPQSHTTPKGLTRLGLTPTPGQDTPRFLHFPAPPPTGSLPLLQQTPLPPLPGSLPSAPPLSLSLPPSLPTKSGRLLGLLLLPRPLGSSPARTRRVNPLGPPWNRPSAATAFLDPPQHSWAALPSPFLLCPPA